MFLKKYPAYKFILAFLDWTLLNVAFFTSLHLHYRKDWGLIYSQFPYFSPEVIAFMGYTSVGLLIFQYHNLYKLNVVLSVANQLARLLKSLLYLVFGFALLSFFSKSSLIVDSRLVLLLFSIISFILLSVSRIGLFQFGYKVLRRYKLDEQNVVIVGVGKTGKLLATHLEMNNSNGVKILGFLDGSFTEPATIFQGLKVIGSTNDIERIVREFRVDEILVCSEDINSGELLEMLERFQRTGATVKIASPLYDLLPSIRFTEHYGEIPLIGLSANTSGTIPEFYKRLFDFVFATIGIAVLSPVFILLAIAIKVDSRGPVFYRQTRIGKNGEPFTFYKFRSMVVGTDSDESRKHKVVQFIRSESTTDGHTKIVDKSKITRVGQFIRKSSIDELPQLLNVLKGDMSLVGPRPCLPYEWEHYEEWHKKRLSVLPGCTGVWQVSGRSAVGFDDMVILDFYYIQNISPLLDVQLILRTFPVMLFGRGAH